MSGKERVRRAELSHNLSVNPNMKKERKKEREKEIKKERKKKERRKERRPKRKIRKGSRIYISERGIKEVKNEYGKKGGASSVW